MQAISLHGPLPCDFLFYIRTAIAIDAISASAVVVACFPIERTLKLP